MKRSINYKSLGGKLSLPRSVPFEESYLINAVQATNEVFEDLTNVAPYVYELLGMRNLSAFVGAAFARELQDASNGLLRLNPHQDGYPDLLLLDKVGLEHFEKVGKENRSKEPFSPFETGGIEIKATCGDVPSAKELVKKGLDKPLIGDERIELVLSYNWKAHHRSTNNLLGLLWDFVEGLPAITAVTFSDQLEEEDWGKIVQPKDGGGRTTSVSIMGKSGIVKMLTNTVLVYEEPRYEAKIKKIAKL